MEVLRTVAATVAGGHRRRVRAARRNGHRHGRTGGGLPPVPGMLGDRRTNELWYQLDEIALYNPSQKIRDAYAGSSSPSKES
jgi:hypothetical protein